MFKVPVDMSYANNHVAEACIKLNMKRECHGSRLDHVLWGLAIK